MLLLVGLLLCVCDAFGVGVGELFQLVVGLFVRVVDWLLIVFGGVGIDEFQFMFVVEWWL